MGKPGFPTPPPGGRVWEGAAFAQGDGETRFPYTPTRWEGLGGRSLRAGGWGNRVSPYSPPGGRVSGAQPLRRGWGNRVSPYSPPGGWVCGAQPLRRGMGKPGFPILPTRWEGFRGAALAQGDGETGFPHPPPGGRVSGAQPLRRGMGKPGFPIPHPVGGSGRAAPSQEVCSSPQHGAAMLRRVIMQPLCRMRRRSPVRHREEHP